MSDALMARMLAARERDVPLGDGKAIKLRRPSALQLMGYRSGEQFSIDPGKAFTHVVGWSGFTEADLVPSGAADSVSFSAELWQMWIEDHPAHWVTVSNALIEMIGDYTTSLASAEKN